MVVHNYTNRRVYQTVGFQKHWNRRVADRRAETDPFRRFILMPVPVLFRRAKEEFVKWYNA